MAVGISSTGCPAVILRIDAVLSPRRDGYPQVIPQVCGPRNHSATLGSGIVGRNRGVRGQDEGVDNPGDGVDELAVLTELRTTLRSLDPDAPARTLLERGTVAFWYRRQLHETLIHLGDLRSAGGLDLAVAPVIWADTVDEVVTVMHPAAGAAGPRSRSARTAGAGRDRPRPHLVAVGVHRLPLRDVPRPSAARRRRWRCWCGGGSPSTTDDSRWTATRPALTAVLADHFVP